jgi:hypothetical protein
VLDLNTQFCIVSRKKLIKILQTETNVKNIMKIEKLQYKIQTPHKC